MDISVNILQVFPEFGYYPSMRDSTCFSYLKLMRHKIFKTYPPQRFSIIVRGGNS